MSEDLREISDIKRIKYVLSTSKESSSPFVIWQTVNDKRLKCNGLITNIVYKDHAIYLEIEVGENIDFNKDDYLFLFQENVNLLFKGKITNTTNNKIVINLAPKIFMEENRVYERFEFSKLQIFVHFNLENDKKFSMQLENISETGLCFSSNTNKQSFFIPETKVFITGIESIELPVKIVSHIVHTTLTSNKNKMVLRVGIKFSKPSPIVKEVLSVLKET